MSDFQLQTEINDSMRREIDSYAEKRKLELEIEKQSSKIQKSYENFWATTGLFTLFFAVISFIFNEPFNYFFLFVLVFLSLIEFVWLFTILRRKKNNLEIWNETPPERRKLNES
jgi:Flp pilus assembly protein TadB